jgi:hypothetical protein
MSIALNLLVIALVLLIAYWWANQGAFGGFLHLLCVLAAATIAFAVWEPLSLWLLSLGGLRVYAWGIGLLFPFAVMLFVFRLASDRIVPDNLNFPASLNYVLGGAFGAASGIVSMGIVLLGGGLLQSQSELLGHAGWSRSSQSQGRPAAPSQGLWLPAHTITADIFANLSAGAMSPESGSASLKNRQPDFDRVSMGLARDGAYDGKSAIAIAPSAVELLGAAFSPAMTLPAALGGSQPIYAVGLQFSQPSFDFGEQFRMSASQVRLIGDSTRGRTAPTAHPVGWTSALAGGGRGFFGFDDISNYLTSPPGQQQVDAWLLFKGNELEGAAPRFVQVKGLRIPITSIEQLDPGAMMAKVMGQGEVQPPEFDPSLRTVAGNDLKVDNTLGQLQLSRNDIPGMRETDQYLTEGKGEFPSKSPRRVNKSLKIKGIFEPEGTRVVQLNITRGRSPIDIWDSPAREQAGADAGLFLVDAEGRSYAPIGYFWKRRNEAEVEIMLDPVRGVRSIDGFPSQGAATADELFAIYRVGAQSKLKAVRLGDIQIANADTDVAAQNGRR